MFGTLETAGRFDLVKRLLLFLISAALHVLAILVLVILPLVFFNVIQEVDLLTFLVAAPTPPAPPPPPRPEAFRPAASSPVPIHDPFLPPLEIPNGIPQPGLEADPVFDTQWISGIGSPGLPDGNPSGVSGSPLGQLFDGFAVSKPEPPPPRTYVRRAPQAIGGNVLEGKLIKRADPAYPRIAVQARVSGVVVLQVNVDEEGNVEGVRVLQGHPLLIEEAVRAVKLWKYSPTLLNGEPVPVTGTVTIIFNLR